jgi:uncharacterized protein
MYGMYGFWLIIALFVLGFVVIGGLGMYGALQLTRPRRTSFEDSIERWGLPEPERLWLTSSDGIRLSGWWFERRGAAASILLCHGHGSNKLTNLWLAGDLYARFNVLLLDVRGHGESEGRHASVGFLERLDILAAVDWLADQGASIGVLGISMGGAAVIHAAAESERIAAVVADSSFARLRGPVYEAICARGYPRRAAGVLAWSVCRVAPWLGTPRGRQWRDPVDVVGRIAPRPLLLIHGEADDFIRISHANDLLSRARDPKELWVLPEAGHARAAEIDPAAYVARLLDFFERSLGAASQPAATAGAHHGHDVSNGQLDEVDRRQGAHAELAGHGRFADGVDGHRHEDVHDGGQRTVKDGITTHEVPRHVAADNEGRE